MWLMLASVLCVVVWFVTLAGWAFLSGSSVMADITAKVISYVTLLGFSAAAYTFIFAQSSWLITLRPLVRWLASASLGVILMLVFAFVFQRAFELYALWQMRK